MEKCSTYPYEKCDHESLGGFDNTSQSTLLDHKEDTFGGSRRRSLQTSLSFLIHFPLVCLYLAWTFVLLHSGTREIEVKVDVSPGPDLVYSPAREAVEYQTVLMNNSLFLDEGPFKGPPREEQTQAWDDILMWSGVRVQQEDLDQINHHTAAKLSDGSGYLVMLDAFHQIHCLDIIRRWIHRDYYEIKDSPMMAIRHVDHCIDSLRRIAMCHGDVEMVTFDWVESQPFPFPNFLVNRECRNWDKILQWAKDNHADDSVIVRPSDVPYIPQATQMPSITLPGQGGGTHWKK